MAATRKNLVKSNRVKLEEVIPLKLPFSISIDPCNLCNFKCEFCAAQASKKEFHFKKQMMEMRLFKKIVDDIEKMGGVQARLKELRLAADGEPMLNPYLTKMISYANDRRIAEHIELVTNGSRLNHVVNSELVNCGVDRIRISVEAIDAEGYMSIAHYKLDYEKFVDNIRDLYIQSRGKCDIYIKTVDAAVNTIEKREQFYRIYQDICDAIFVDNVIPLWSDFQELEEKFEIRPTGLHGQKLQKVKVCPYPFYSCIIHSNGDVAVCCADWERKYIIGNVGAEDFGDIWQGDKLRSLWIQHLEGKRNENELCARCLLPEYDCNDNIDNYSEELLKKLEETGYEERKR